MVFRVHLTQVQHFEAVKNNWRPLIPTTQLILLLIAGISTPKKECLRQKLMAN